MFGVRFAPGRVICVIATGMRGGGEREMRVRLDVPDNLPTLSQLAVRSGTETVDLLMQRSTNVATGARANWGETEMNIRGRRIIFAALVTTSLGGSAIPALAQAEAPPTAGVEDAGVGDIVVSARRRNETIQQTPIAMTALAPATLEAKATMNIGDLQGAAPNVLITAQSTGASTANTSIRGLAFADVEKSFDPTIAIVVDGVFIGTSTGQFLDFFDTSSIEVLRGPQGTLFGRNTIGGVINIKRSRPTGEWGGKFQATYGSYDTWSASGVINAPIVDGVLAAKVFYYHSQSDGFYYNATAKQRDGGTNNENFGASFLFTPSSNFDALLTVEKQVQDFHPVQSNIANSSEFFCTIEPAVECNRNTTTDLYTVFGKVAPGHYSSPAVTLETNLDLGGIKLTSITGYRTSHEDVQFDADASSADLYYVDRVQHYKQFSQELRAAGKLVDSLDYVIGGYYYHHSYDLLQNTRLFGSLLPNPQYATGTSTSYAAFGDFDWNFADRWRLSFGGRFTHDKKTFSNAFLPVQIGGGSKSFNKFTPKVGVDFRPTDDYMIYGSWSRGYRAGGFSNRAQTPVSSSLPFGPETVDSFEVGAKSAFFDRKLLFNIAAFYSKYSDLQQSTTIPGGSTGNQTVITNVGSARIKGIEIDFTAKPVPHLTLNGGLGLLKSHFRGFVTQAPDPAYAATSGIFANFDYSAVRMIYSPKVTASINAEYKTQTSLGEAAFNIGYRYITPYDQQISNGGIVATTASADGIHHTYVIGRNDPRVRSDTQGLLDASMSLGFDLNGKKAKVTVYGRNLANDRGPTSAFTVAGLWSFATAREPRVFGGKLSYEF